MAPSPSPAMMDGGRMNGTSPGMGDAGRDGEDGSGDGGDGGEDGYGGDGDMALGADVASPTGDDDDAMGSG